VRLSVGIEDVDDLLEDLDRAFSALNHLPASDKVLSPMFA